MENFADNLTAVEPSKPEGASSEAWNSLDTEQQSQVTQGTQVTDPSFAKTHVKDLINDQKEAVSLKLDYEGKVNLNKTPYGKLVTEGYSEDEIDDVMLEEAEHLVGTKGLSVDEAVASVDKKLNKSSYTKDKKAFTEQNKAMISKFVAANGAYGATIYDDVVNAFSGKGDAEDIRRIENAVKTMKNRGLVDDYSIENGTVTIQGQIFPIESSFWDTITAHSNEIGFPIFQALTTGRLAVGHTKAANKIMQYAWGATSAVSGKTSDDKKLEPYVDKEFRMTPQDKLAVSGKTLYGDVASAGGAEAVLGTFLRYGMAGYKHLRDFWQDATGEAKNINLVMEDITNITGKTTDQINKETVEFLNTVDGGAGIIEKGVDSAEFKQQAVFHQVFNDEKLGGYLNQTMANREVNNAMSSRIAKRRENVEKTIQHGLQLKTGDDAVDIAEQTYKDAGNVYGATKSNILNYMKGYKNIDIVGLQKAVSKSIETMATDPSLLVRIDKDKAVLDNIFKKLEDKVSRITDVDSAFSFRESYNKVLDQFKIYGGKWDTTHPMLKNVRDEVDEVIKKAIQDNPAIPKPEKETLIKNWTTGKDVLDKTSRATGTSLFKLISKEGAEADKIIKTLLKKVDTRKAAYEKIMQMFSPEQRLHVEKSLIKEAVKPKQGAIDYTEAALKLSKLKDVTTSPEVKGIIENIEHLSRLYGRDIKAWQLSNRFLETRGVDTSIATTIGGVVARQKINRTIQLVTRLYPAIMDHIVDKFFNIPMSGGMIAKPLTKYVAKRTPLGDLDKQLRGKALESAMVDNVAAALRNTGSTKEWLIKAMDLNVIPKNLQESVTDTIRALEMSSEDLEISHPTIKAEYDDFMRTHRNMYAKSYKAKAATNKNEFDKAMKEMKEAAAEAKASRDKWFYRNYPNPTGEELAKKMEADLASRAEYDKLQAEGEEYWRLQSNPKIEHTHGVEMDMHSEVYPSKQNVPATLDTNNIVKEVDKDREFVQQGGIDTEVAPIVTPQTVHDTVKKDFLHTALPSPEAPIVTPQTVDAALQAKRDMPPVEAFKRGYKKEIPSETYAGKGAKARSEWDSTMTSGGIETTGKYGLPQSIASHPDLESLLDAGALPEYKRKGPRGRVNKSGGYRLPNNTDGFSPQTTVETGAIQTELTPEAVKRIRANKATPEDKAILKRELDRMSSKPDSNKLKALYTNLQLEQEAEDAFPTAANQLRTHK